MSDPNPVVVPPPTQFMPTLTAGGNDKRADTLAYIAIFGLLFFGIAGVIVSVASPLATGAREICILMIGYLLKEVSGVYSFTFGTTSSNQTKDNTINNLSK